MIAALTLLLVTTGAEPDTTRVTAPQPGAVVADFTLPDIHRRRRALGDFSDARLLVIVVTGTECPLANRYVPTLVELHDAFSPKGVQFLAINSNVQDSFIEVSAHAQERNIPFPVLKDFDHRGVDALGAQRTPEAFVLDADRVIRYHGRIDDQYAVGVTRVKPTSHDLKTAIEELLAEKPVSTPTTEVEGCIIGRINESRTDKPLTYAGDVARILQQNCQQCHRPGQIGPMPLQSFEDAQAWSETIREVVLEQRMPPWHADPRFGEFSNDRRMNPRDVETLVAWIDQGSPPGKLDDAPAAPEFDDDWTIGTPDAVFHMPEPFSVPASGVLDYQRFVVDPGFEQDMWVQAAECRPGNRAVVHHVLVYMKVPGERLYDDDGKAATVAGWAPGDMPARFPAGTAKRIPAGSQLVFEVHYTPNGTPQTDRSSIGIRFAKEPPKHEVETNILANMQLRIPPQAAHHQEEFVYTFAKDARLLSFMPHMHLRGISAKYVAEYPDGRSETLLSVPDYDFNWQSVYRFREPLVIPQGTRLRWIACWDNSADNPRNPDADREVRWGLQTWDEMQNGWMEIVWKPAADGKTNDE